MHTPLPLSQTHLTRRFLKGMLAVRNALVLATMVIVLVAMGPFRLHVPVLPMVAVLGFLALTGIARARRLREQTPPTEAQVFTGMINDVLALTALFYLSGGASNPFVWFYLFPAIISAMVLSPSRARAMSALTVICYSFLLFFFEPVHEVGMPEPASSFQLHVLGMWLGFILSAGFVAFVVAGLADRLRKRERTLNEAREQALRNESMVTLGAMAAGAAHDLGTPLGTMAILATDLQDDAVVRQHPELGEKLRLMREQVQRCKQTLSVFSSSAGAARAESGQAMSVRSFLDGLLDQWRSINPDTELELQTTGQKDSAWLFVEPALTQALHNLLDNAAQVSPEHILLTCTCSSNALTIKIIDHGPGIAPDVLQTLGSRPVASGNDGMGVGLYLATSTIRRLGGTLTLDNLPEGGAMALVTLPLFNSDQHGPQNAIVEPS